MIELSVDLDKIVKSLAEQVERPSDEVMKEIDDFIKDGYTPMGAIATWKSQNKNLLGKRTEFFVRVLGKSPIRTADVSETRSQRVTDLYFLTVDEAGIVEVKPATLWGDRVEMSDDFKLGKVYFLKAKERGGKLSYISAVEPADDDKVPRLEELPEHKIQYASPGQILDYVDKLDLFHGWVGRLIRAKQSGKTIGFELADAESFPVTVWCSERFGPLPEELVDSMQALQEGDEVLTYAYVSLGKTSGEPRLSAKSVFILGKDGDGD